MEDMNQMELTKMTIEEFSRIQGYMQLADKQSAVYSSLKMRYIELKVMLTSCGVNLTELDFIKE